jgi:hypothetical protein
MLDLITAVCRHLHEERIDELSAPEFYFEMRQLTVIYRDQNSLQSARRAKDTGDLNG